MSEIARLRKENERLRAELESAQEDASWAILGSMNGQDIEALAFLVLMQAAKSAREDLKDIMEQVKALNRKKLLRLLARRTTDCHGSFHVVRDRIGDVERSAEKLLDRLDALKLDGLPDELSEMGEMESLRMQMYLDRLSKLMSTLSNILKKMSDTASQIAQNLK